ncbi:MAG: ATP-dependent Clp protease adaptor ClpS [Bacteroidales bacterium]|nr:ATP-dependent Clp protease adaptor ClpS [Bacteroidales bacterium]
MEQLEPEKQKSVVVRDEIVVSPSYDVIMHNDDETTMEFVIDLLTRVFFKNATDAVSLMMKVHNEGSAVVGTYNSYDVAVSKVMKAESLARASSFPLKLTVEDHSNR